MGRNIKIKSKLGALLASARDSHGLSQREVAELFGLGDVGQSTISMWERGVRPIRFEGEARTAAAELLGIKPSEVDALVREDETLRARTRDRRRLSRRYQKTQEEKPRRSRDYAEPAPIEETPAKSSAPLPPPDTDPVSSILPALIANDASLAHVEADALIRLVRRFLAVEKVLSDL
jgi:transcriptional regulator with XRE-family HTH domain